MSTSDILIAAAIFSTVLCVLALIDKYKKLGKEDAKGNEYIIPTIIAFLILGGIWTTYELGYHSEKSSKKFEAKLDSVQIQANEFERKYDSVTNEDKDLNEYQTTLLLDSAIKPLVILSKLTGGFGDVSAVFTISNYNKFALRNIRVEIRDEYYDKYRGGVYNQPNRKYPRLLPNTINEYVYFSRIKEPVYKFKYTITVGWDAEVYFLFYECEIDKKSNTPKIISRRLEKMHKEIDFDTYFNLPK